MHLLNIPLGARAGREYGIREGGKNHSGQA